MQLDDIRVEVRDRNLVRHGPILGDLDIEVTQLHNGVGTWTLRLRADHHLAPVLLEPGSGIIVTDLSTGRTIMSGPTTSPLRQASASEPGATLEVSGVDDSIILADMLAFPQPSNPDPTTQNVAADQRSGPAETLMHQYVGANIGPSAPAERRRNLVLGPNEARGAVTTKRARFVPLLELLQELAAPDGLGFRVHQSGERLLFTTHRVQDRSANVRLSLDHGSLSSGKLVTAPPGLTRAIVAGEGLDVRRAYYFGSTDESLAAETQWGRRIERFVAASGSSTAEHRQAALEVLAQEGFTQRSLQIVPSETTGQRFGLDWYIGDVVGVEFLGETFAVNVTGAILRVDAEGIRWGITIGDDAQFSQTSAISNVVVDLRDRLGKLERNVDLLDDTGWIPFPFASGFKNYDAGDPAKCFYRRIGNVVYLRGYVAPTSGNFPAGTASLVGTLPSGFRPSYHHMTTTGGAQLNHPARLHIAASGTVNIAPPTSSASGYYSIACSFPID